MEKEKVKTVAMTATMEELNLIRNSLIESESVKAALLMQEGMDKLKIISDVEQLMIKEEHDAKKIQNTVKKKPEPKQDDNVEDYDDYEDA